MSMSAGSATDAGAVEITGLHKWFGEFHVLADINLKVGRGERIVICGPSGSGKSTLLRCINRLEDFQRGEIVVDGMVLTRDIQRVDAIRREIGMSGVFDTSDIIPLPCNPDAIAIGYGLRDGRKVTPITRLIPKDELLSSVPNTISFERYPELKNRLFIAADHYTVADITTLVAVDLMRPAKLIVPEELVNLHRWHLQIGERTSSSA